MLAAIRAHQLGEAALPRLDRDWIRYDDPLAQFTKLVESVGGRVVFIDREAEIESHLAELPAYQGAKQIVSYVGSIAGNIDLATIDDPHELETVDWAILPGAFGVSENGAIWVTDEQLKHRVIYFITQHLVLVLPADQIVHNLHEAYARLQIGTSSQGLFMSGPSKTADIEQSLVIGAHGPRSLTVFCVRPAAGLLG
ncbi:MAG: LUD domain-containing protein [Pirellulales bacterium]|nr:LUD domain-containing protein [Pirellulales bacterium]